MQLGQFVVDDALLWTGFVHAGGVRLWDDLVNSSITRQI
jgi:hypothetical protein